MLWTFEADLSYPDMCIDFLSYSFDGLQAEIHMLCARSNFLHIIVVNDDGAKINERDLRECAVQDYNISGAAYERSHYPLHTPTVSVAHNLILVSTFYMVCAYGATSLSLLWHRRYGSEPRDTFAFTRILLVDDDYGVVLRIRDADNIDAPYVNPYVIIVDVLTGDDVVKK